MARRRTAAPRSLADELRRWPDEDLVALLRARPDLVLPRPGEFATLVTRATSRASVQRAVDGLDTAQLQVIEVLAALPEPVSPAEVGRRWGAPAGPVLAGLRALALVWGPARSLYLVRAVREVLGPYPAQLGPPLAEALGRRSPQRLGQLLEDLGLSPAGDPGAALERLTGYLSDAGVLEGLLAGAPSGVRAVLDRLVWGPPVGQVAQADRAVRRAGANGPVEWLLAHGLLAVADPAHVVLPREVGLALRGGRVHRSTETAPPAPAVRSRPGRAVTGAAAGAAAEVVRLVEALGEQWGAAPPPVLRAGGLGVRELHRTAVALELDDAAAAFVVELSHVSGLVADDGEADPRWAPTPAFDAWLAGGTGQRWAALATAWLSTTRCPQLAGTRDARDSPRCALGGDLDRALAPAVRGWVLRTLAEARTEARTETRTETRVTEPDRLAAVDPDGLRERLDWLSPRRAGGARNALIDWVLEDAARLGVVGAGALAPHGRVLVERPDDPGAVAAALDDALPPTVDHILLQADLTAVAPGPPEPGLAGELALMAEVESRGGAIVYRFSAGSIRRALDAGRSADDLLELLRTRSRTEVPQPLAYLVVDVGRRHGRVRVGAAQAFVRADDETALAALLADRRASRLGLRRLAPTVLAAQAPAATVLEVLREIGLAPVAEGVDGDVVISRRERYRTGPRTPPGPVVPPLPTSPLGPSAGSLLTGAPPAGMPAPASEAALSTVVATVRAADRLAEQARAAGDPAAGPDGSGRRPGPERGPGRGSGPERGPGRGSGPERGSGPGGTGTSNGSAGGSGPDGVPPVPSGQTREVIARLRQAAAAREAVWIGYADAEGGTAPRLIQPLHVDGGAVHALDRVSQRVRTFAVHRVTGVTAAAP